MHSHWRSTRAQLRTRLFPTVDALLAGYLAVRRVRDTTPDRAIANFEAKGGAADGTAAAAPAFSPFDPAPARAPDTGAEAVGPGCDVHARDVAFFKLLSDLARAQCFTRNTVVQLVSAGLVRSAALLLRGQTLKASAGRLKPYVGQRLGVSLCVRCADTHACTSTPLVAPASLPTWWAATIAARGGEYDASLRALFSGRMPLVRGAVPSCWIVVRSSSD